MIGPDGSLGLTAAAVEQVRTAQRQVASLIDDVEAVAGRLRATAEIPWAGDAARAWRDRVDGTRRDLAGGVEELGELLDLLDALVHRIRP